MPQLLALLIRVLDTPEMASIDLAPASSVELNKFVIELATPPSLELAKAAIPFNAPRAALTALETIGIFIKGAVTFCTHSFTVVNALSKKLPNPLATLAKIPTTPLPRAKNAPITPLAIVLPTSNNFSKI